VPYTQVIANIILVNLLIAMFNKTYNEVESESLLLWRMQAWALLDEYSEKPSLPPPISILYLLPRFFRWLRRCCSHNAVANTPAPALSLGQEDMDSRLDRFEEKHTERYLEACQTEQENSSESRIARLDGSVRHVRVVVSDLQSTAKRQEGYLLRLMQALASEKQVTRALLRQQR
jgi:hypothetical protein